MSHNLQWSMTKVFNWYTTPILRLELLTCSERSPLMSNNFLKNILLEKLIIVFIRLIFRVSLNRKLTTKAELDKKGNQAGAKIVV